MEKNELMCSMSMKEQQETTGGVVICTILGVAITGKALAWATATGIFAAGVYVGYNQKQLYERVFIYRYDA